MILLAVSIGTVLVLPWVLKNIGIWDKVKRWYSLTLSGLILGVFTAFISLFTSTWEALAFVSNSASYQFLLLGIQGIATFLLSVDLLGIFVALLKQK